MYFGLPDSAGNLERMNEILAAVTARLAAAYCGELGTHYREDFFIVNSRVRPYNADSLYLKLTLPFVTDSEEFEITHAPICGWSDFNPCFTCCHGSALTNGDKVFLDTKLGVATVLCPCDMRLYRVRYMAGFETSDEGIVQLPPELRTEMAPLIESRWNALCSDEDEECNTCNSSDPAVMVKFQSNNLLFRFLPAAVSPVHTRLVPEDDEPLPMGATG